MLSNMFEAYSRKNDISTFIKHSKPKKIFLLHLFLLHFTVLFKYKLSN